METLEHVCAELGYPQSIRIDQGPEFISKDLDLWAYIKGVELDASRPGNPRDNAFIESLNGKFRAECLNAHWFMNLTDARQKCEPWRIDDNNHRPHSSIGYSVPAALMKSSEPPTLSKLGGIFSRQMVQKKGQAQLQFDDGQQNLDQC